MTLHRTVSPTASERARHAIAPWTVEVVVPLLVVKATGHDWYGRSYAPGSLVLWTHKRKQMTWHDAFVPAGSAEAGVPAVTVESGVQFSDMYPAAQATPYPKDPLGRKSIVMGGTCDSVGVGGCWLGGCYGPFTKKFQIQKQINLWIDLIKLDILTALQ